MEEIKDKEDRVFRTDVLYFENRERIFSLQNNLSKLIDFNLERYRKVNMDTDTNIFLNNALKLSIIYKNIGG